MTDEQKLVEEVGKQVAWWSHSEDEVWEEDRQFAVKIIDVVKRNIGVVAKVCPECNGCYKSLCCQSCINGVVSRKGGE
jgi:hypothetical protein